MSEFPPPPTFHGEYANALPAAASGAFYNVDGTYNFGYLDE